MAEEKPDRPLYPRGFASLLPDLAHNRLSWAGSVISVVALCNIGFLFLIGYFGRYSSPYLGIFTWVIFPALLLLGITLQLLGMWLEHRRRRRTGHADAEPF